MNIARTIIAAAAAATAFSAVAFAQDAEFQMPEECIPASTMGGMDHAAMGHGNMQGGPAGGMDPAMMEMMGGVDLETMPEHVQENMRRMMVTMPAMHDGMMIEDADVAFACGMIAHHQGAIDMAQVLVDHGSDPTMIALANEIIAAQVEEIAQMRSWLADNAD